MGDWRGNMIPLPHKVPLFSTYLTKLFSVISVFCFLAGRWGRRFFQGNGSIAQFTTERSGSFRQKYLLDCSLVEE